MWHLVLPFSVVPLGIAESRIMGVEGGSNSWFVFPSFSLSHTQVIHVDETCVIVVVILMWACYLLEEASITLPLSLEHFIFLVSISAYRNNNI